MNPRMMQAVLVASLFLGPVLTVSGLLSLLEGSRDSLAFALVFLGVPGTAVWVTTMWLAFKEAFW